MWHISVFGDDFEAFNSFSIADHIIKVDWAVFLDPTWLEKSGRLVNLSIEGVGGC